MKKAIKWAPVLIWMAVIFFLSAQPHLPTPDHRWLETLIEKSAHAFEYAVLAALVVRALSVPNGKRRLAFGAGVLVASLYALSDELHQTYVPGRLADWSDIMFDWMGAIVGSWLWLYGRRAYHAITWSDDVIRQASEKESLREG